MQLVGELHLAGVDEDVDARARGAGHRLGGGVDVAGHAAGKAADAGVSHLARHGVDGAELVGRRGGEAGLDDVDAHGGEALGDLELVTLGEKNPGGLLSVAQRRVEDGDSVGHGCSCSRSQSSSRFARRRTTSVRCAPVRHRAGAPRRFSAAG